VTRLLRLVVAIVIAGSQILLPVVALAEPTVVVTNQPMFTGAGISWFQVTYTTDTQMDLDWMLGGSGVNIMIRSKYGGYPADIPNETVAPYDGNLVYYGDGLATTTFSDTSMDFDENPGSIFYKAWAQKADGTWYVTTGTGNKESAVVTLIAFLLLALGLTIPAFIWRKALLAFAGSGAWIIFAVYCYTKSTAPATGVWDVYYAVFFLGCGLTLVSALEPAIMRTPKAEKGEDLELDDVDNIEKEMGDLYKQTRIPRMHRRSHVSNRAGKGPQY
jgi:hypothetical protein